MPIMYQRVHQGSAPDIWLPPKPQLSPHKHRDIIYGAKAQIIHEEDTSPPLDEAGIKVLFYGRAFYNKLLATLNYIGTQ